MDVLYIVAPAYNEQANIEDFVRDWYPIVRDVSAGSRLLVVDDGSTDQTGALLHDLEETLPQLRCITKQNGGHGSAVTFGYRQAIAAGADWVFQTDADRQTVPDEFEGFWTGRESWDAIIGERTNRQDGLSRKAVERILCLLVRLCFGVRVRDANAPFRLMRVSALKQELETLERECSLINAILTALFVKHGHRVDFRRITFLSRTHGISSLGLRDFLRIGCNAISEFWIISRNGACRRVAS